MNCPRCNKLTDIIYKLDTGETCDDCMDSDEITHVNAIRRQSWLDTLEQLQQ